MTHRYLVTGGAGFIGSNFIRSVFEHQPEATVTSLDALTYAGVFATVEELDEFTGHTFIKGDIRDADLVGSIVPGHDVVVHFAAETHVDRSISGPLPFVDTNVVGTGVLLEAVQKVGARMIHVSTDEVYGSVTDGFALEDAPLHPSSPYSASKAGSDLLALSYYATYGTDVVVTRCTNNYGPYQFPEKVIPLFVTNLLQGEKVPLYGDGKNERDWIHVDDHCSAIRLLVEAGKAGQVYNIGAGEPLANLTLTRLILAEFGRDEASIDWVEDRPGHDYRYAVDISKVRALGWEPARKLEDRLHETIDWYRNRSDWWRPLRQESR